MPGRTVPPQVGHVEGFYPSKNFKRPAPGHKQGGGGQWAVHT